LDFYYAKAVVVGFNHCDVCLYSDEGHIHLVLVWFLYPPPLNIKKFTNLGWQGVIQFVEKEEYKKTAGLERRRRHWF
jgi:hypothetical protein